VEYWKKACFKVFSRKVLNYCIRYKENTTLGTKLIPLLDFTIKIIATGGKEWLL
jgi:hypothetical protein